MYKKLISVCFGRQIYSFDFDLEGSHFLVTGSLEFIALAHALRRLSDTVRTLTGNQSKFSLHLADSILMLK